MMTLKKFTAILSVVLLILLIPFVAMQFTKEVFWTVGDFIVMGLLLLSTGLVLEFAARKITKLKYRILICSGIVLLFILTWVELAVGIFGTPLAGS